MFFELVGTILAGVAAGLLVWALNRLLKGRLPSWLSPVAAGGAMLLAAISSEYGWYDRTVNTLPPGMIVADAVEEQSFYRPWTYVVPFVSRFVAVDQASIRQHPDHPNQRIVNLLFYGRWSQIRQVPVMFDCVGSRRADLMDGIEFAEDGAIANADWLSLTRSDPVLVAACEAA